MIPVICRTNLDDYKREVWPKKFCCRPIPGDKVQSTSGKWLRIHNITHAKNPELRWADTEEERYMIPESVLLIELHK